MRISNIKKYIGGADNTAFYEMYEGDTTNWTFSSEDADFTDYTFDVDAELFQVSVSYNGNSSINLDSFTKVSTASKRTLANAITDVEAPTDDEANSFFTLNIPTDILSGFNNGDNTYETTPNDDEPYLVLVKITLTSAGRVNSFMRGFIMRYFPSV